MSSDDERGSALAVMSRNWRSALVVNSLHDALEETERQRDELAQKLRCLSPPTLNTRNLLLCPLDIGLGRWSSILCNTRWFVRTTEA